MKSDNLSFSKDVADTIGVEAAVILKFIEDNKISSSSIEDIAEIILEKFSFMEAVSYTHLTLPTTPYV